MAVYPDAISESLEQLRHSGRGSANASSGRAVNFDCGGFVEISIEISEDSGVITAARFRSNGCGFMVAAAEAACSDLNREELANLDGLEGIRKTLADKFDCEPASRPMCFDAVIDAVTAAFQEHRNQVVAEFAGEKALVCTCFGISEERILNFIAAEQPVTAQQVTDACRAGSGCGSCRMIIQELIDTAGLERLMTRS